MAITMASLTTKAMATTFFRDNSESGVAEIFGRSAATIAGGGTDNHHRP